MAATNGAIQQHQGGGLAGLDPETMAALVAGGDCSRLTPGQRTAYYSARCDAAGLDPRAQPFAFMRLNGKEVLYALKAASDQLAAKHGVRMTIVSQTTEDGIRVVTVRAEAKDGRQTDEIGAVPVKGLVGDALCNAMMKAVTKAKRRAVLSLCGLGMLDETEAESIPQAQPIRSVEAEVLPPAGKIEAPPAEAACTVTVETKAEAPKNPASGPGMALWLRVLKLEDGNKKAAQAHFAAAAAKVFGEKPKPSNEWTEDDAAKVSEIIFPTDVPF
jgi:hypothetical protein